MTVATFPISSQADRGPGQRRRPRFSRAAPAALRLTDDDVAVLRHVARHRFLRSTHLVRLIGRPPKKLVERLGLLYHAGYLDRPRAQLDFFATAGSAPMVYALGNCGAELLADVDGRPVPKVDWTDKNRTAGRPFIEHTLLIADVMVAFEYALRTRPDVRLMPPAKILERAPVATQQAKSPWTIRARVPIASQTRELALVPDQVFGLDFTAERKRAYFFLEADRATMPVTRSKLAQTSFARKLATYWHANRAHEHTRQFGISNFRVLTVTSSRARIQSMIDAVREVSGGHASYMFLFTDTASLVASPDILEHAWITAKGDTMRLMPAGGAPRPTSSPGTIASHGSSSS